MAATHRTIFVPANVWGLIKNIHVDTKITFLPIPQVILWGFAEMQAAIFKMAAMPGTEMSLMMVALNLWDSIRYQDHA